MPVSSKSLKSRVMRMRQRGFKLLQHSTFSKRPKGKLVGFALYFDMKNQRFKRLQMPISVYNEVFNPNHS